MHNQRAESVRYAYDDFIGIVWDHVQPETGWYDAQAAREDIFVTRAKHRNMGIPEGITNLSQALALSAVIQAKRTMSRHFTPEDIIGE